MGRPINKKFFGNTNSPYDNEQTSGKTGVGGEGITISVSNSGTLYSQGINFTVGAPNIKGGIQATVNKSVNSAGNVALTVNNPGSGYTSAPTINLVKPTTVAGVTGDMANGGFTLTNLSSVAGIYVGMRVDSDWGFPTVRYITQVGTDSVTMGTAASASTSSATLTFTDMGASFAKTVGLTSSKQNALAFTSYLTTGSSAVANGDIMKQEASRRYLVQNSQGQGQVKLVTSDTLAAGEMNLIATDFGGATYFVKKLTGRKAVLVGRTGTGTEAVTMVTDFDGIRTGVARWTLGAATGTVVTIANV